MAVLESPTVAGQYVQVDSNNNLSVSEGLPAHPTAGGFYTVSGWTTAAVAAALSANTMLASLRLAVGSTRKAYLSRLRLVINVVTPGANGGIPGVIAWQRFTAQTPTGGNARTPNEQNEPLATSTDMTDVRDSNAALTGTAPTFGNIVAAAMTPTFPQLTSGVVNGAFEWIYEPSYPTVLQPGDGLALRTQVAMPATQTWGYAYTIQWFEK